MKSLFIWILSVLLFLSFSCKKEQTTEEKDKNVTNVTVEENGKSLPEYNTTQYVKYQVWFYKNKDDAGKNPKDVKDKILMEFGNKVTVLGDKQIGDKLFFNVSLPDKTTYWVAAEHLAEKFIVINQPDVICYKQPDTAYVNSSAKLQPGDFAYFVKEQDGFVNVDFISYIPRGKKDQIVWVGNVWIKDGFTDDLKAAKEAYFLSRAYNDLYGKTPNKENAIQKLKDILDINSGEETEVTYVIKTLLNELTGIKVESIDGTDDLN